MKKKLVMKKFLMWSLLRCCDFGFIRVFEWSIQKLKPINVNNCVPTPPLKSDADIDPKKTTMIS